MPIHSIISSMMDKVVDGYLGRSPAAGVESQRSFWEEARSRRHPDHPVVRAFTEPKIRHIDSIVHMREDTRVLDVASGNGYFGYPLSKRSRCVCLDLARQMLSMNPCRDLVQGSALNLPFDDNSFDVVFASNMLHHLDCPGAAVGEMRRVTREYVVLVEPNRNNPGLFALGLLRPEERLSLRFTPGYLENLALEAGLEARECRAMGMVTPNKQPRHLVPLLRLMDGPSPFGAYVVLIAHKVSRDAVRPDVHAVAG